MKRTALITGAAKRIGNALAKHLAKNGWNIAIHYNRSEQDAINLKNDLASIYPKQQFEVFKAELSNSSEVEKLVPACLKFFGSCNLLINNASVFEPSFLKETSVDFYNQQMEINTRAPFILMRDFANYCKQGNIINFVDTRITNNQSSFAAYSLSKKALWELTKMAALEFAPKIRVNAIAPGVTLSPEDKDESYLQNLAQKTPMKKPGGLEPIIQSLDYILNNGHLTGQLLFGDGGENLI